ncbi:hypothetical protein BRADI_1g52131v3 [Brachypodium distachyon]|uniref:Reverse transcriptase zinc-binding domain-containing protein n=1 Tax=Brachypodium distachyon TaxID=15368 RepID=A0A2K2DR20_BRADI|nr:hypothetical protein BRADI_1g52131v3 [Brachypodium distachyon]
MGLPLPCDAFDRALFRASTQISLGDGASTLFWHGAWLSDGSSPGQRWPGLLAIATRKHRTVQMELRDRNCIRSLLRINSPQHLSDFVELWDCISTVTLSLQQDRICWRWTSSETYTTALTYKAQFLGSIPPFSSSKLWTTQAEPNFSQEVWGHIQLWSQNTSVPITATPCGSINELWGLAISGLPKRERRNLSGRLIYTWWGVWKECNRRIFRASSMTALQVAYLVWEKYQGRLRACSPNPGG